MEKPEPESGFGILEKGVAMKIGKYKYAIKQLCRWLKALPWRFNMLFAGGLQLYLTKQKNKFPEKNAAKC